MAVDKDLPQEMGSGAVPTDGPSLVSCTTRGGTVVEHRVDVAELATWGRMRQALAGVPDSAFLVDFGSDVTVTLVFHELK